MTWDGWVWPMPALGAGSRPVISDGFKATAIPGVRRQHLGVDLMYRRAVSGAAAPPGFSKGFFVETGKGQVLAAGPGKVHTVDRSDPHGISVEIDHSIVTGEGPRVTVYRHLASALVQAGQIVAPGAAVGIVGADPTQGDRALNHLHFELWDTSRPRAAGQGRRDAFSFDPAPVLRIWRVKTASGGFTSPDISPAGEEDAGEGEQVSGLTVAALVDLSVVPGGIL